MGVMMWMMMRGKKEPHSHRPVAGGADQAGAEVETS